MNLFKLIQAGHELKNPTVWSNLQSLTNVIAALATGAVSAARLFGFDLPLTDEQLLQAAGAVATILFVGNSVLAVATTKDAGLK
jgi:hypothetical protein